MTSTTETTETLRAEIERLQTELVECRSLIDPQVPELAKLKKQAKAAEAFETLVKACGYVANGTSTSVTIFQDDATKDWFVRVGKKDYYVGSNIFEAVEELAKNLKED